MGWYPKNPALGQIIQSDVVGENPDMGFISHLEWTALEAATAATDGVHAFITDAGDGTAKTVITEITDPPCPRNITATVDDVTGDDADIKAVSVIITGTNINDEEIEETLPAFTVNTSGTVVGNLAFKTVTKIVSPAHDSPYDAKVSIGFGDKLGMPYMRATSPCIDAFLGTTIQGTAPTVVNDVDEIEKNTIDLSSALNGSIVHAYMVV